MENTTEIQIMVSEVKRKDFKYFVTVFNMINGKIIDTENIYFDAIHIYEAREKREGIVLALKGMLEDFKSVKEKIDFDNKLEEDFKKFEVEISKVNII